MPQKKRGRPARQARTEPETPQNQAAQERLAERQRQREKMEEFEKQQQEQKNEEYTKLTEEYENTPESNVARTPEAAEAKSHREADNEMLFEELARAGRRQAAINAGRAPEEEPEAQQEPEEVKEFILLGGRHRENSPAGPIVYVYSKDHETRVPSTKDLDVKFANKFRRVDGRTMTPRTHEQLVDRMSLTDKPMHVRHPHGQFNQFTATTDREAQERLEESRVAAPQRSRQKSDDDS